MSLCAHHDCLSAEAPQAKTALQVLCEPYDARPFEVFAGQVKVRDIGTQFDVRHRANGIAVAVLDGEVEVSDKSGDAPVSGVFPTDNLEQALQTVAATLPIRITRTGANAWRIDSR